MEREKNLTFWSLDIQTFFLFSNSFCQKFVFSWNENYLPVVHLLALVSVHCNWAWQVELHFGQIFC